MIDSIHARWVERIGNELVLDVTSPVESAMKGAYDGARNVALIVPDFFRARAENIALRKKIGELEQQVVGLQEDLRQERRLGEMVEYCDGFGSEKVIARVIGNDPTGWFSTILVDKGSAHGVRKNLPVLSASGLAGHVIETFRFSSKVLLLTDPDSKVSVIAQDGRAQGVVQGDGRNGCLLKYVETTADIKAGDVIITSGFSRMYPKGLLVGEIIDVKNITGNLFQWARVLPGTNFRKLEEVAILLAPQSSSENTPATDPVDQETEPAGPESS
jgi:rod shape-determining protein MreC